MKKDLIRLSALLLFLLYIFLVGKIFESPRHESSPVVDITPDNNERVATTTSGISQCSPGLVPDLQGDQVVCTSRPLDKNIYTLTGYYSTYTREAASLDYDSTRDPKPETIVCSRFVILSGDNALITKYKNEYSQETWKYLDNQGHVIFNVNPQKLPSDQRTILLQSSLHKPIIVDVKQAIPGESGCEMRCCHGYIDIVSVQKN
jgi:hypothetical protein